MELIIAGRKHSMRTEAFAWESDPGVYTLRVDSDDNMEFWMQMNVKVSDGSVLYINGRVPTDTVPAANSERFFTNCKAFGLKKNGRILEIFHTAIPRDIFRVVLNTEDIKISM